MKMDKKIKILIALIIVEGIFILSLILPHYTSYEFKPIKFYYNELDSYTKYEILRRGYIIVEFLYNFTDKKYLEKLDKDFDNQLIFVINNIEKNSIILERMCFFNIENCFDSPNKIKETKIENLEKDLCNFIIKKPSKCLLELT